MAPSIGSCLAVVVFDRRKLWQHPNKIFLFGSNYLVGTHSCQVQRWQYSEVLKPLLLQLMHASVEWYPEYSQKNTNYENMQNHQLQKESNSVYNYCIWHYFVSVCINVCWICVDKNSCCGLLTCCIEIVMQWQVTISVLMLKIYGKLCTYFSKNFPCWLGLIA